MVLAAPGPLLTPPPFSSPPKTREGTYKFQSGWEVGVIKAFDKKGPHAGKFSVKYKVHSNWWTHSLLREGYGKDKH